MSNLPALYELAHEFREAADKLADMDLDAQTVADTLEGVRLPVEDKCRQVGFVIRNMESMAAQIKEAEQAMASRRKALEARAESVREYLLRNMQDCGISKIESPYFVLSVRQNPASVIVDDPETLAFAAPQFIVTKTEQSVDKKAVKAAIEAGEDVPGCRLERKVSLQIK